MKTVTIVEAEDMTVEGESSEPTACLNVVKVESRFNKDFQVLQMNP